MNIFNDYIFEISLFHWSKCTIECAIRLTLISKSARARGEDSADIVMKILTRILTRKVAEVSWNEYLLDQYLVRDINPPNNQFCFPQFFSTNFSQFEQLKKITNFLLVQNRFFFLSFGPTKSCLSFSTAQTEKNSWEKIGENKIGFLVDWCHEQDI